jgi:hypothetical protein
MLNRIPRATNLANSPTNFCFCLFQVLGGLELVATGAITSVNPDRISLKRIRLAGHPFKINKHSAVCRYMFWSVCVLCTV